MRPRHAQDVVLAQLRHLAFDDETRLAVAKDRLALAEAELAAARSAFDSASGRADISQRVAHAAEELLPHAADDRGGPPDPPVGPGGPDDEKKTIAAEMLAYIATRQPATRREIEDHLKGARPDIKTSGVSPELSRLVKEGVLVRPKRAVYAIPPPPEGSDA